MWHLTIKPSTSSTKRNHSVHVATVNIVTDQLIKNDNTSDVIIKYNWHHSNSKTWNEFKVSLLLYCYILLYYLYDVITLEISTLCRAWERTFCSFVSFCSLSTSSSSLNLVNIKYTMWKTNEMTVILCNT